MSAKTHTADTMMTAIKRVRLEVCHATAILRIYIHDPDAQGILQALTLAIDDADKLLAKLSTRSKTP